MTTFKNVNLLLVGIFGLFTGCKNPVDSLAYYGINGTITDSISSLPIPKIRVIREETDYILFSDTAYTDSFGNYNFTFVDYYSKKPAFTIKVEDTDGELNNGNYITREINVHYSSADWITMTTDKEYYGKAVKIFNIKLQTK